MQFYKYHGLGNDYLIYDCQKNNVSLSSKAIRQICHRHFGLGSDGILVGPIFEDSSIGIKIYNPDGSEAEKSGNGVRIFAKYYRDAYLKNIEYPMQTPLKLNTLGGEVEVRYNNPSGSNMTVSMGKLSFLKDTVGAVNVPEEMVAIPLTFNNTTYQCTCVSIGNPHCVIPLETISKEQVCEIGKYSETASYFPNRINTQIVKIIDRKNIQIEIYERGAGYTLASGSSSCAAAGAVYKLGYVDSPVNVHMPGGILQIEIDKNFHVKMTGTVSYVGEMTLSEEFVKEQIVPIKENHSKNRKNYFAFG